MALPSSQRPSTGAFISDARSIGLFGLLKSPGFAGVATITVARSGGTGAASVVVAGRALDTTLPDYRELDHLHGVRA